MKTEDEIRKKIQRLENILEDVRFYSGPDPNVSHTSAICRELKVLKWVLE